MRNKRKKNKNNNDNNVIKQEKQENIQPKSNRLLNMTLVFSFRLFWISLLLTGAISFFYNKEDAGFVISTGVATTYLFGMVAIFSALIKMWKISKE